MARTPAPQVHVVAVKGERLAEAQAGCGEQTEEGGVGVRPHPRRRWEPRGLADDALDLLVAVDVGRAPPVAVGEEPRGRNFGAGIRGAQPGGEAAHVGQALRPCGGRGVGRCLRPAERQLGGDDRRPLAVEELDEAVEKGTRFPELRAESATQGEIRLKGIVKRAHLAPALVGQGNATSRRAPKSSFA